MEVVYNKWFITSIIALVESPEFLVFKENISCHCSDSEVELCNFLKISMSACNRFDYILEVEYI